MRTRFGRTGGSSIRGQVEVRDEVTTASLGDAKAQAKRAYETRDYASALEWFQVAVRTAKPSDRVELSVLLSNSVACRLQLMASSRFAKKAPPANAEAVEGVGRHVPELDDVEGISDNDKDDNDECEYSRHAKAAVDEARRCLQLNPSWSQGYLRLAEALIVVAPKGGGRQRGGGAKQSSSNEACNCLQTALRLEPNLTQARRLLQQELRRDPEVPVPRRVTFAPTGLARSPSGRRDWTTHANDEGDIDAEPEEATVPGVTARRYELHDAASVPRAQPFRSSFLRVRRKVTSLVRRNVDRLCQLGMLLALVLFLGELVLLLDELAVQTPAFRARDASSTSIITRFGPVNLVRQCRRASATFRGNYRPSHIYQHYQQALTFDKYREAYQEFMVRSQLRRPSPPRDAQRLAQAVYDTHVRQSSSLLLPRRISSSEAGVGLVCWLVLLPLVLTSMAYMRRHLVASATLPARHVRRIAGNYASSLFGQRGGRRRLPHAPIGQQ